MSGKEASLSPWLARNPSKRWAEVFFLAYSPFWITWALCVVVPFQLYEYCEEMGYMVIGLAAAVPTVVIPLLMPGKADQGKAWHERFWVKANVWIAVFSFIGNYFWTHYFFKLLGAAYTFPSWKLNEIPIPLYLMTHAYFCFYHTLSNMLLRRVKHAMLRYPRTVRWLAMSATVFTVSYVTAFMETLTIAHFPYYTFVDRNRMYTVGSLFYAIYFFVSFPMFFRIDEEGPGSAKGSAHKQPERWGVSRCFFDSLAAGMLVTILLDLWRISVGAIVQRDGASDALIWTSL